MYGKANSHIPHASSPAYIKHTHIHTHTHTHIHKHTHTHTQVHTYTIHFIRIRHKLSPIYHTPVSHSLSLSYTHTHTHTQALSIFHMLFTLSMFPSYTSHCDSLTHTPRTFSRTPRTSFSYATRSLYNKHVCCRDREGVWFMRQSVCVCGVRGIYIHHTLSLYNKHVCYRDRQCVRFKREYVFVCVV